MFGTRAHRPWSTGCSSDRETRIIYGFAQTSVRRTPRRPERTVLSILVWPSRIRTGRGSPVGLEMIDAFARRGEWAPWSSSMGAILLRQGRTLMVHDLLLRGRTGRARHLV